MIGDEIAVDRDALASLLAKHHVRKLSVFGSAARGELSETSDIDLLVEFEPNKAPSLGGLVELSDKLSTLMGGRPVDLATPSILNNPFRRRSIAADLKVLHAA
jgi:predicted nucleotidyltransferase